MGIEKSKTVHGSVPDFTAIARQETREQQLRTLLSACAATLLQARDSVPEVIRFKAQLHAPKERIDKVRVHLRVLWQKLEEWENGLASAEG